MVDAYTLKEQIKDVIASLDPDMYDVAIAHLQDAVAAISAVENGQATKFTLHDRLFLGQVRVAQRPRRVK